MSMSYEEAFASNLSAWMRRAGLPHDKARDMERAGRAKNAVGESSRRGAMFIAAAIHSSTKLGMVNNREVFIFSVIASQMLFMKVYDNVGVPDLVLADKALSLCFNKNDLKEGTEVFLKNAFNLVGFVNEVYQVRDNEKKNPSITNMIIDQVRGKIA